MIKESWKSQEDTAISLKLEPPWLPDGLDAIFLLFLQRISWYFLCLLFWKVLLGIE